MKRCGILLILACFIVLLVLPEIGYSQVPLQGETIFLPIILNSDQSGSNGLDNGDFESGNFGWIEFEDSTFFDFPLIVQETDMPPPITPYNGEWATWLGGDSELLTYIEQQVTIPQPEPELVYWYWIDSISKCDASYGGVTLDGVLIEHYQLCTATDTGGWRKRTIKLSSYAGQNINLRILSRTDVDNFSSLYIDAVTITNSP
jgi:hypothetical protein